jgi:Na+/proline symporter
MVPSYLGWIAAQLVALGIILDIITGMGVSVGILISTLLVLSYTLLGGMWAVTITDLVQTIIIIVGLVVVAIIFTERAGGIYPIISSAPKGFFSFLPNPDWTSRWEYFAAWITVGLGSVPQQDVFQRIMSAKSEKVAARSALVAAGMYLSIALIPLYLVLALMYLYPTHFNGDLQYALPRSILEHTNLPIQVLFFGALVSAIMSTCSGAILAPATVLAENIVKPLYSRDISDKSMLLLLRASVFVIGIAAFGMAQASNNIYELVAESSAISLVTLFIPMIYGLYFSKASTLPAILSMAVGTCIWFYALSYSTEYPPVLLGLGGSFCGLLIGIFWKYIKQ